VDRRAFVTGLGAVLAAPLTADAQQPGRVARVGVLRSSPNPEDVTYKQGFHEPGYREGTNIVIEERTPGALKTFPVSQQK
jgi:hypothetical protein